MAYSKDDMLIKKAAQKSNSTVLTPGAKNTMLTKAAEDKEKEEKEKAAKSGTSKSAATSTTKSNTKSTATSNSTNYSFMNFDAAKKIGGIDNAALQATAKKAEEKAAARSAAKAELKESGEAYTNAVQESKKYAYKKFGVHVDADEGSFIKNNKYYRAHEYKRFLTENPTSGSKEASALDDISNLTGGKSWTEFAESATSEDLNKIDTGKLNDTEKVLLESAKSKALDREESTRIRENKQETGARYAAARSKVLEDRVSTLKAKGADNYSALDVDFDNPYELEVEVAALSAVYSNEDLDKAKESINRQLAKVAETKAREDREEAAIQSRITGYERGGVSDAAEKEQTALDALEAKKTDTSDLERTLTSAFDLINAAKSAKWEDKAEHIKKASDWSETSAKKDDKEIIINGTERELEALFNGQYDVTSRSVYAADLGLDPTALEVYPKMKEDEKAIVRYLVRSGRADEAQDYVSSISLTVNARAAQTDAEEQKKFADEHPIIASAGAVLSAPLRGIEGLESAAADAGKIYIEKDYEPRDENSDMSQWHRYTDTTREEVKKDMGAGGQFFYDTVMSMGDNAVNTVLAAAMGGGSSLTLALMGGDVYQSSYKDAIERGATAEDAFKYGVTKAGIEAATEKLPLEKIISMGKDAAKNGIKVSGKVIAELAEQAGTEGMEEIISNLLGYVADGVIMGENSEYNRAVADYMENGEKTREEAEKAALMDNVYDTILAGLGGAISGVGMAAGAKAYGAVVGKAAGASKTAASEAAEAAKTMQTEAPPSPIGAEAEAEIPAAAEQNTQEEQKTQGTQEAQETQETAGTPQSVKFSIKHDDNGGAYVDIDNDVLDGVPKEQWRTAVTKWLNENLKGKEFTAESDGDNIKITSDSTHEYRKRGRSYDAKMHLAGNLDEAITVSRKTSEADDKVLENGKLKHGEKAKNGWDYRQFDFEYDGQRYTASLNVQKNDNGHALYDVTNIRKKEATASTGTQESLASGVTTAVASEGIVPQSEENVNTFSEENAAEAAQAETQPTQEAANTPEDALNDYAPGARVMSIEEGAELMRQRAAELEAQGGGESEEAKALIQKAQDAVTAKTHGDRLGMKIKLFDGKSNEVDGVTIGDTTYININTPGERSIAYTAAREIKARHSAAVQAQRAAQQTQENSADMQQPEAALAEAQEAEAEAENPIKEKPQTLNDFVPGAKKMDYAEAETEIRRKINELKVKNNASVDDNGNTETKDRIGFLRNQGSRIVAMKNFSKKSGIKIAFFAEENSGFGGMKIDDTVYLNIYGEKNLQKTLGHELLHVLKENDLDAYTEIMKSFKAEIEENGGENALFYARQIYREKYEDAPGYDVNDNDAIEEEMLADLAGEMSVDGFFGKSIIDFATESGNKGVLRRVSEAIGNIIARLRSALGRGEYYGEAKSEITAWVGNAQKVHTELLKAYRDLVQSGAAASESSEAKFSIERDADGSKYVKIDNDVLDEVPRKQWTNVVEKWLNQNFKGKEFTAESDGDKIKILGITSNEYRKPGKNYNAKLHLAGNLDEAITVSEKTSEADDKVLEDGNLKHGKKAKDGWDYREFEFEYDGQRYTASINVQKGVNGHVLYDVTDIRKKEAATSPATQENPEPGVKSAAASADNISQPSANVNTSSEKNNGSEEKSGSDGTVAEQKKSGGAKFSFNSFVKRMESENKKAAEAEAKEREAYIASELEKKLSGTLDGLSDYTKRTIADAAKHLASGDAETIEQWKNMLAASIRDNDQMYFTELDPSQEVLLDYFSGKGQKAATKVVTYTTKDGEVKSKRVRSGNNGTMIKIPKEDAGDIPAQAFTSVFGVGHWSRTKGIEAGPCYEELREMGVQLADETTAHDRLAAIMDAMEEAKEQRDSGIPMLSEEDIDLIATEAINESMEAADSKIREAKEREAERIREIEEKWQKMHEEQEKSYIDSLEREERFEAQAAENARLFGKDANKQLTMDERRASAKERKEKLGEILSRGQLTEEQKETLWNNIRTRLEEKGLGEKITAFTESVRQRAAEQDTSKINTPEREEYRHQTAKEYYEKYEAAKKERKAYIIIGLPAAGKSTIAETIQRESGAMIVDSDIIKAGDEKTGFEGIPEYDGGIGVSAVHNESKAIAEEVLDEYATQNGDNVIYQKLGGDAESISKTITDFNSKGYSVTLVLNDLPIEKALERDISRFEETGRLVDPKVLLECGYNPIETYKELKKRGMCDGYEIYSNDVERGERARLVESLSRSVGRVGGSVYGDREGIGRETSSENGRVGEGVSSSQKVARYQNRAERIAGQGWSAEYAEEAATLIDDIEFELRSDKANTDENSVVPRLTDEEREELINSRAKVAAEAHEAIREAQRTKSERGIYGDFSNMTAFGERITRQRLAASEKYADEAARYAKENKLPKAVVLAAKDLAKKVKSAGVELNNELYASYERAVLQKYNITGKQIQTYHRHIEELAKLYDKVELTRKDIRAEQQKGFKAALKILMADSGEMRDISNLSSQVNDVRRVIDHICRVDSYKEAGEAVKGNVERQRSLINASKILTETFADTISKNERLKGEWVNEYRERVKKLNIKIGSLKSGLVQAYGEGVLTKTELEALTTPENAKRITEAARELRDIYKEILPRINEIRFIMGKSDINPPKLNLNMEIPSENENEHVTINMLIGRYMEEVDKATVEAETIAALAKKGASANEVAKLFGISEEVAKAAIEHAGDEHWASYVRVLGNDYAKDGLKGVQNAEAYVLTAQQAWNLIYSGHEYNARTGTVQYDYFPHLGEDDVLLRKYGVVGGMIEGMKRSISKLPTSINGMTENFRPNSKWQRFLQQRTGWKTEYDAMGGFDRYIDNIGTYIFHTSDITKIRMLENHIREKYNKLGMDRFALSDFANWLRQYGDTLAGKQHKIDRAAQETFFSRKIAGASRALLNGVSKNQIGWNLGTAITNLGVMGQTIADVFGEATYKLTDKNLTGAAQDIASVVREVLRNPISEDYIQKSTFLTNRFYESIRLDKTGITNAIEKISDAGFAVQNLTDKLGIIYSHRILTQSYIHDGMSEKAAIEHADDELRRLAGSRTYGEMPIIFNSKLMQYATKYQLEPMNQMMDMIKSPARKTILAAADRDKDGLAAALALAVPGIIKAGLAAGAANLINKLFKKVKGYEVLLDPIDMALAVIDGLKDGDSLAEIASDVGEEIPIVNNVLKAVNGEMADMIGIGAMVSAFNAVKSIAKMATGGESDTDLTSALLDIAMIFNPLGGTAQIRKSIQGAAVLTKGYYESGTGEDKQLRYAVEATPLNWARALAFGKSALPEVQEWWEKDYPKLTKADSKAFREIYDSYDISTKEVYELLERYETLTKEKGYGAYEFVTEELGNKFDTYDKYYVYKLLTADSDATPPERMVTAEKVIAERFIETGDRDLLIPDVTETVITRDGKKYKAELNAEGQEAYREAYEKELFGTIQKWVGNYDADELNGEWLDSAIEEGKKSAKEKANAAVADNKSCYEAEKEVKETQEESANNYEIMLQEKEKLGYGDEEAAWRYFQRTDRAWIMPERAESFTAGQSVMWTTFAESGNEKVLPTERSESFQQDKVKYTLTEAQRERMNEVYLEAYYREIEKYANQPTDVREAELQDAKKAALSEAKSVIMAEYELEGTPVK